ncbi:DUF397 domain-containing protein [Streptomyces sp. NPDC049040]|uniref:DUF397 domain-containing protein n=1 Tax=Streptomyces sp. NPDC049040 TaxID=3365593 RepID=UPI00371EBD0D
MSGFAEHDLTPAVWRKSSHSGASNGDCVEVADGVPGFAPVRDSKDPQGPALVFPAAAWTHFLTAVKDGWFPA